MDNMDIVRACSLVRAYHRMTGKSVKIGIEIWKYSHEPNVRITTQISTVDPESYDCEVEYRKTIDEIEEYIQSREILFRRFDNE